MAIASKSLLEPRPISTSNGQHSSKLFGNTTDFVNAIAGCLLLIQGALLVWGATVNSPTLNEPAHLVAGMSYWRFGCFRLFHVNPPLARLVAAAPVMLASHKIDWSSVRESPRGRSEFWLGEEFMIENGQRGMDLMVRARWACIPFCLLAGGICFSWARSLYGDISALFALILWCFCPTVLAHGSLVTADMAGTSLALAAGYAFWKWLKHPSWWHTVSSGIVLGLAELAKMTIVVLFVLWPLVWLVYRWQQRTTMRSADWLTESFMLLVRTGVAIWIINVGYAFEGTCTRLGDFQFTSEALCGQSYRGVEGDGNRFVGTWLESIPVPLPRHYVEGMDMQCAIFSQPSHSYMNGVFSERGWWYYYIYALSVKLPLGIWVLMACAALAVPRGVDKSEHRDTFAVIAPAIMILVFVSSQSNFTEHMRYVMPIIPFMCVAISRSALVLSRKRPWRSRLVVAALVWSTASSLSVSPHSLSYFNEIAGGPVHGSEHLLNSNADWGQDLLYLRRWLQSHPSAKPLKLAYFGGFDPRALGIEYSVPSDLSSNEGGESSSRMPEPGWYAISACFLRGLPWTVNPSRGRSLAYRQNALCYFQDLKPAAFAGYSIYIYHVDALTSYESTKMTILQASHNGK